MAPALRISRCTRSRSQLRLLWGFCHLWKHGNICLCMYGFRSTKVCFVDYSEALMIKIQNKQSFYGNAPADSFSAATEGPWHLGNGPSRGEWQPRSLNPNESPAPAGALDPVMHLYTSESHKPTWSWALTETCLGNPIGGQMKSDIPWGKSGPSFFEVPGPLQTGLRVWDILSSICNTGQLRARSQRSDHTNRLRLSVHFLSRVYFWLRLALPETCRETVEMFIINSHHFRPKQCLFQQSSIYSQSDMQWGGLEANNLSTSPCPHYCVTSGTKFDSYNAVPLRVFKLPLMGNRKRQTLR